MKRVLISIAIIIFALILSANAFGQSSQKGRTSSKQNQRKKKPGSIRPKPTVNDEGIYYIDSWNALGKNKSTARTKNRKPIGRPKGICTGCCDPCYNDDVNQRKNRSKNAFGQNGGKGKSRSHKNARSTKNYEKNSHAKVKFTDLQITTTTERRKPRKH